MITADLRTPSIASLPSQLVAPRDRPTDTDERRHAPAVGEVFRLSTPAGRDSRLQSARTPIASNNLAPTEKGLASQNAGGLWFSL